MFTLALFFYQGVRHGDAANCLYGVIYWREGNPALLVLDGDSYYISASSSKMKD